MSDFLATLAARAMGAEVGLRPRPASIFEPVTEPMTVSDSEMSPARYEEAESHVATTAAVPDPAAGPALAAPPRSAHRVPPVPVEPAEPAREWGEPRHTIERIVEERRTPAPVPSPVAPPPPAVPPEATVRVTTQTVPAHVVTVEKTHEIRTTLRREHTVREETVPREAPPVSSPRRARTAQAAPAASRSSGSAAPLVPPAAVEPPVTIEVTIGRVEVRAVQPAAPAKREVRTGNGPSLPLEAYLKQRNGGRS